MTNETLIQEYEYKAEMQQLLHLIIHSLYTHPEVFLRELISNASDALNKVRFMQVTNTPVLDSDAALGITIEIDEKTKSFAIEDTGIGMTRDDLVERIGTIASSGTLDFIRSARSGEGAIDGSELIGKFGVGFYSAFMVTDEIHIETRHAGTDSTGLRWSSRGEGRFTIEEIDRPHRGTRIIFTLKDDASEFAHVWRVKDVIRKYSNFVNFPISINGEQVNTVTALWQRAKDEVSDTERGEFFTFIAGDATPPLGHLHFGVEGRVTFKALLFIPSTPLGRYLDPREEKGPQLYSNRVFIQDDCKDLLPDYLRFVRGVIDTEDLPLNVSRELTQSSPFIMRIREIVTGRVLALLEEWAAKDEELYNRFWKAFAPLFKLGVSTDVANKERLLDLLRYESTAAPAGELVSLATYTSRMPADQKEIYYIAGEHRAMIEHNPNLEYFRKHGLEVLFLTDPIDVFVVPTLGEYEGKTFASIEKADVDFAQATVSDADAADGAPALLAAFREVLGDRVKDVAESRRLVDSAATLVVAASGLDPQMERMMRAIDSNFESAKKILELNLSHPLMRNLARLAASSPADPLLRDAIEQVYEGALIMERALTAPADFVRRMTDFMERATRV